AVDARARARGQSRQEPHVLVRARVERRHRAPLHQPRRRRVARRSVRAARGRRARARPRRGAVGGDRRAEDAHRRADRPGGGAQGERPGDRRRRRDAPARLPPGADRRRGAAPPARARARRRVAQPLRAARGVGAGARARGRRATGRDPMTDDEEAFARAAKLVARSGDVERFRDRPVERALLDEIIARATTWWPSRFAHPPWRVMVVVGDERERLVGKVAEALARHWGLGALGPRGLASDAVLNAPALVLVFSTVPASEGVEAFGLVAGAVQNL